MRAAAWMDAHLAERLFLVGDAPTIADVALYPYTSMAQEGGYDLSAFTHISAWLARMRALPGFTPLLETA
jgi:glutathione S-transferase